MLKDEVNRGGYNDKPLTKKKPIEYGVLEKHKVAPSIQPETGGKQG